jgi:squalene-associated FAD-dependent desaturase
MNGSSAGTRNLSLQEAQNFCGQIVSRSGSNFARSFELLSLERRKGMKALYAFARLADDATDGKENDDRHFDWDAKCWYDWIETLRQRDDPASSPTSDLERIRPALADAVQRFRIPLSSLRQIVEGVDRDNVPSLRLMDWDDTRDYCHLVASSVGRACLSIWSIDETNAFSEHVLQAALDCGVAFQVTNIIRDVVEDAKRNRIYLPLRDIQRCQLSDEEWIAYGNAAGKINPDEAKKVFEVIRIQVERARALYQSGLGVIDVLTEDSKRMFLLMWNTYRSLLEKVASRPLGIWNERISLSRWEKGTLFLKHALTPVFQADLRRHSRTNQRVPSVNASDIESESADPNSNRMIGKSIAVVGGGLAGIQAALQLARHGAEVTLFESKSRLGGRVGSFQDIESGQSVDYCQHVGMKCCKSLVQWLKDTNQEEWWEVQKELHFIAPNRKKIRINSLPLPAPFHLSGLLFKWPGLSPVERIRVAWALTCLLRTKRTVASNRTFAIEWLREHLQTDGCIRKFWATILVSALGEQVDRVTLGAMHQVLIEGFAASRDAFHLLVPSRSLVSLLDDHVRVQLERVGVKVRLATKIKSVSRRNADGVIVDTGTHEGFEGVVVAVPWHAFEGLMGQSIALQSSPITGVHTWWDRPWLSQPHAILIDRLSQWVFPAPATEENIQHPAGLHYYQVVISGSRDLPKGDHDKILREVQRDLAESIPESAVASLLRGKVVTDPNSVFSVEPGHESSRLATDKFAAERIWLAGDWTETGWPATMEGALRSGSIAAEAVLAAMGRPAKLLDSAS